MTPAKPKRMEVIAENIPYELKQKKNWVLWRWVFRDGKWTKPPYQTNGKPAESNNAETWTDFDSALAASRNGGKCDGIGFVITKDSGYTGIDFDDCIDATGEVDSDIINEILDLDSYTEESPSGTGYKAMVRGKLPAGGHHGERIGVFDSGRYFCITGQRVSGSADIEPRQEQLNQFVKKYFPDDFKPKEAKPAKPPAQLSLTEQEIIDKALSANDGGKFRRLWEGDFSGYASHSEGDLALCCKLAFWTGRDPQMIDTLFRQSKLYRDDKWERRDYRENTIKKAIEQTSETYDPRRADEIHKGGDRPGAEQAGNLTPSNFPPKAALEITEDEWTSAQITPSCIVQDYLYADVATLAAPGGTGKTTLQLYEMVHIVLGRDLYGLKVQKKGWCLIVTAEDTRGILIARLREICAALGLSPEEIAQIRRDIIILDVADFNMKMIHMADGNIVVSPDVDAIITRYKDDPPAMVVFDPAASFGVGEAKINDNEQGLINAARKIRNAFKCCVRIVCHTGKANAREKTLDQYTSRGGSALPDGSRMVAVMQAWSPDTRLKLPQGCNADQGASVTILARPKLSYAKGNLPNIFIRRVGWAFEHFTEVFFSEEDTQRAVKDQVLRFLSSQAAAGVFHSKGSLEASAAQLSITRKTLRDVVAQLKAEGRIIETPLPKERCQGGKKTYLAAA